MADLIESNIYIALCFDYNRRAVVRVSKWGCVLFIIVDLFTRKSKNKAFLSVNPKKYGPFYAEIPKCGHFMRKSQNVNLFMAEIAKYRHFKHKSRNVLEFHTQIQKSTFCNFTHKKVTFWNFTYKKGPHFGISHTK